MVIAFGQASAYTAMEAQKTLIWSQQVWKYHSQQYKAENQYLSIVSFTANYSFLSGLNLELQ